VITKVIFTKTPYSAVYIIKGINIDILIFTETKNKVSIEK